MKWNRDFHFIEINLLVNLGTTEPKRIFCWVKQGSEGGFFPAEAQLSQATAAALFSPTPLKLPLAMESGNATFVSAAQLVDRRISHDAEVPDLRQLAKEGASGEDSGYTVRDVRYEGPAFFASRKIPIPQVLIDELNHILYTKRERVGLDRNKSPTRFNCDISHYFPLMKESDYFVWLCDSTGSSQIVHGSLPWVEPRLDDCGQQTLPLELRFSVRRCLTYLRLKIWTRMMVFPICFSVFRPPTMALAWHTHASQSARNGSRFPRDRNSPYTTIFSIQLHFPSTWWFRIQNLSQTKPTILFFCFTSPPSAFSCSYSWTLSCFRNDFSAYDGLDQIIVSVAVIKPKPDVFLDEVRSNTFRSCKFHTNFSSINTFRLSTSSFSPPQSRLWSSPSCLSVVTSIRVSWKSCLVRNFS